ncbi:zona pellucida-like domain-containing protein 1 [Thalassophryne amazonica]|uniref:zona pellucida-like domain-containing protein 1 n=1 Tax=Thalassophryne amazonica TaxID=390379 RepID=UPI0014725C82|nr:zona pellucida-like domain-containing protein 1 [Thalassophryne amazonica]
MAFFSFFILALCIVGRDALTKNDCGPHFRRPEYSDINVTCGTSAIHLAIQICPAIYTGYNASLLILNHVQGDLDCKGTLDASVSPPVVRFSFPIREGNACGSKFVTTSAPGTGIFSNFSIIQTVNVSGVVRSLDVTVGMVSYNTELKYLYSCAYPLEYFINNTQLDVSSSSIALKDNNGSFISTLSITLYKDINYTTPLIIPRLGLELRTIIFVQVAASNLTSQYFVHLDRCYASTSPQPSNSTFFNLFVSCSVDPMTTMLENGESQKARFYFPVFRFIEQENETVSTYYLHCITRLCERTMCSTFKQCNRRKRHAETSVVQQKPSETSVLTVPIKAMTENCM